MKKIDDKVAITLTMDGNTHNFCSETCMSNSHIIKTLTRRSLASWDRVCSFHYMCVFLCSFISSSVLNVAPHILHLSSSDKLTHLLIFLFLSTFVCLIVRKP